MVLATVPTAPAFRPASAPTMTSANAPLLLPSLAMPFTTVSSRRHLASSMPSTTDFPPTTMMTRPRARTVLGSLPPAALRAVLSRLPVSQVLALRGASHDVNTAVHAFLAQWLLHARVEARLSVSTLGSGAAAGAGGDAVLATVPLHVAAVAPARKLAVLVPATAAAAISPATSPSPVSPAPVSSQVPATVCQCTCTVAPREQPAAVVAVDVVQTSVWWCLRMTVGREGGHVPGGDDDEAAMYRHRLVDYIETGPYSPSHDEVHVLGRSPPSPPGSPPTETQQQFFAGERPKIARRGSRESPAAPTSATTGPRLMHGPHVLQTPESAFSVAIRESFAPHARILHVDLSPMVVHWVHVLRLFRGATDMRMPRQPAPMQSAARFGAPSWSVHGEPAKVLPRFCPACFFNYHEPALTAQLGGAAATAGTGMRGSGLERTALRVPAVSAPSSAAVPDVTNTVRPSSAPAVGARSPPAIASARTTVGKLIVSPTRSTAAASSAAAAAWAGAAVAPPLSFGGLVQSAHSVAAGMATAQQRRRPRMPASLALGGWHKLTDKDSQNLHRGSHL
ncbi:hypothetical protein H9P43_005490 [Blastocladiella emersonii ATCC 22665]|nr:hypothetical protein H9P43_005490 [Blastocladiella emersonii ATCC 22665]